jgi:hypothetical protein
VEEVHCEFLHLIIASSDHDWNYNLVHVGSSLFFACTGVIIKSNKASTSFVTSLSLVRSIDDDSKILHDLRVGDTNFSILCTLLICDHGNHPPN